MIVSSHSGLPGIAPGLQAKTILHVNMMASRYSLRCTTNHLTVFPDFLVQRNITQRNFVASRYMLFGLNLIFVLYAPDFYGFPWKQLNNCSSHLVVGMNLDGSFFRHVVSPSKLAHERRQPR